MNKYYYLSILSLFLFVGIACNSQTETSETVLTENEATITEEKPVVEQSETPNVSQPPFARFLNMAEDEETTEPVVKPEPEPKPESIVVPKKPEPKPELIIAPKEPEPKPEPVVTQKTPEPKPISEPESFVNFFIKPEVTSKPPEERRLAVAQKPDKPILPSKQVELPTAEPNKAEIAKSDSNWIPFLYFYQPPRLWYQPSTFSVVFQAPLPPPAQPLIAPIIPVYPILNVQPVYIPQVVPSWHGAPKLVYPNGVIIKPKIYFSNQPLRNSFRAVTP